MRDSDRLITPRVVISLVIVAGLLVAATIAAVTYLQSIGRDPEPMLKLAGLAVTAVTSLGGFVLQLVNRATIAKTERNTGVLANAVYEVADAMPQRIPRHAAEPETVAFIGAPPVPRGSEYPA